MIRCSRCFKVYQYSDNECGLFKHSSEKKILVHLICNDCGSHYETMKIITETGVVDVLKLRDINNHYNNIIEGSDWHFIDNSKLPLSTYSSSNSIPVPSTITVKRPRSLCYFKFKYIIC